jgi:signal transduction histidine kinase
MPLGVGVAAVCAVFAATIAASLLAERNVGPDLLPHGFCFTWLPALLWTHVISDALIGLAYISIPVTLWLLVRRRTDLPFNWVFLLFGLFIVSCGFTHFLAIWNVWQPDYWLSGSVKAFTAAASVVTAASLIPLVPRVLAIPTVERLRMTLESLEREVAERSRIEQELRRVQAELESRVAERTRALAEAMNRAIHERARAETARQEAEAASRGKDDFIAMLSHELRNPLAPIAQSHYVIERTQNLDGAGRTAMAIARRQLLQLKRLVNDLMDASRIARGKLQLEPREVDLRQVVHDAVDTVMPIVIARSQKLDLDVQAERVSVHGDSDRLVQVLENLLSNASKYSHDGSRIRVGLEVLGDEARITVTDDGVGIDPEHLDRIFNLYVQLDAPKARAPSGLGVGLALVESIVQMHGGSVGVESGGLGRGAAFWVRLPLRRTREQGQARSGESN